MFTMTTHNISPFFSIRLDKGAPTPIYLQIAEGISALLTNGALPAGYVLPPERALCEHFGISRMTLRQAMSLLDREVAAAPSVRDFFELRDQQKVYEILRLRLKDGEPLALELARIPERLCPGLERFDVAKNSLYQILEESYGLRLENCVEEISAEAPTSKLKNLLALPKNAAVLVVHRKTFAEDGRAVELTRSTYRGDQYSAIVRSVRKKKPILKASTSS